MSLEEERARQAASSAAASTSAAAQLEPVPEGVSTQITDPTPATEPKGAELTGAVLPTSSETMRQGPPENTAEVDMMSGGAGGDDDEDEDLKRALALSQGLDEGDDVEMGAAGGLDDTVDDEDDDIARASASDLACTLSLFETTLTLASIPCCSRSLYAGRRSRREEAVCRGPVEPPVLFPPPCCGRATCMPFFCSYTIAPALV